MKIYILCDKSKMGDDYSSLPQGYEKVFLFDEVPWQVTLDNVQRLSRQVDEKLSNVEPGDKIVLNGPSWLIAYVGYAWLTMDWRAHLDFLIYDTNTRTYKDITLGYT